MSSSALVNALGVEEFARQVEAEFVHLQDGPSTLTQAEIDRVARRFTDPVLPALPAADADYDHKLATDAAFARWVGRNVRAHRVPGYASVVLSLKAHGVAPGDITSEQLEIVGAVAVDECSEPSGRGLRRRGGVVERERLRGIGEVPESGARRGGVPVDEHPPFADDQVPRREIVVTHQLGAGRGDGALPTRVRRRNEPCRRIVDCPHHRAHASQLRGREGT